MADDITKSIFITIKSPEKVFFEGEAYALTSRDEVGEFDVLPMHANFISIISEFLVIHEKSGKMSEIKIESGILRASKNKVNIFLGIEAFQETVIKENTAKVNSQ